MRRLSPVQHGERDRLAKERAAAFAAMQKTVADSNEAIRAVVLRTWTEVRAHESASNDAIESYNAAVAATNDFRKSAADEADRFRKTKSPSWRASDIGVSHGEWVETLREKVETVERSAIESLDDTEIEEPTEEDEDITMEPDET